MTESMLTVEVESLRAQLKELTAQVALIKDALKETLALFPDGFIQDKLSRVFDDDQQRAIYTLVGKK